MRALMKIRQLQLFVLQAPPVSITANDDCEFVPITTSNVHLLHPLRNRAMADKYVQFAAEGKWGVAALHHGQFVGHAWASESGNSAATLNGYLKAHANCALIHDCFVDPDFRGRSIFQRMIAHLSVEVLAADRQARIFIDTDIGNDASRHGIIKTGFRELGRTTYLFVGRKVIWRRQPDSRFI